MSTMQSEAGCGANPIGWGAKRGLSESAHDRLPAGGDIQPNHYGPIGRIASERQKNNRLRFMAQSDEAAAEAQKKEAEKEAERLKKEAEKELAFALPGLFSKADPERMARACAAAREAGVDEATVVEAEGKMARVLEREEAEARRLKEEEEEKAAEAARALAREQAPEATKLRRVSMAAVSDIDVDELQSAISDARAADVSPQAINEGVAKVAQARRWRRASEE